MKFRFTSRLQTEKIKPDELRAMFDAGLIGPHPDYSLPWVRLTAPLTGTSSIPGAGDFCVPVGFVYDQATVPKLLRWFFKPDGKYLARPAARHDLVTPWPPKNGGPTIANPLLGEILTTKEAAQELRDGCIAEGMWPPFARMIGWAVGKYGPQWEMPKLNTNK